MEAKAALRDATGGEGDPTVIDYLCECLADFEFGEDAGSDVFDAFGDMMVSAWA